MERFWEWALSAVLLLGIGAAVWECSASSECGNGVKEEGELCDNGPANGTQGNGCSAACQPISIPRAMVQVSYQRLKVDTPVFPSYPSPTCLDLGIEKAHVVLEGPTPKDETWSCSTQQMLYDPVEPGRYRATVTLLGAGDQPVTRSVQSSMVDVQITGTTTNINVAFLETDFLRQDYQGNLYFVPYWGADKETCADAAVTRQTLKLTRPGETTPVMTMTARGQKLDGVETAPCFVKTGAMPEEEVEMMPWGYYDLSLTGDAGGAPATHCGTFRIFVAPGVATPSFDLIVPLQSTDGGACP